MKNKLSFGVLLLVMVFSSFAYGRWVDIQVKASLNFVDLVQEVASWVQGAVNRHDQNEIKRIKESVPKLVGQLSMLAGEKNALAKYIQSFNSLTTSKTEFKERYEEKVNKLNNILKDIRKTIEKLDPHWEGENPIAKFNVSKVVAEKEQFLQEHSFYSTPNDNLYGVNLDELANAFNNEAYNLLRSSIELSEILKKHNNAN